MEKQKQTKFTYSIQQLKNLYQTQAALIAQGLRLFIKMQRDDVPQNLLEHECESRGLETPIIGYDKLNTEQQKAYEQAFAKWNEILEEMLFTFEELATPAGDASSRNPYIQWSNEAKEEMKAAGREQFTKEDLPNGVHRWTNNLPHAPEEVDKATEEYWDKIHRGLDLYAKYFQSLLQI